MTTTPATITVHDFAKQLEHEQRERLAREYPAIDLDGAIDLGGSRYRASVTVGPKYTRVDFGDSGKYMVVNATGGIFGIKSYGVIHRGHAFGTLATVAEWDWSGYAPVRRAAEKRG